MGSNGKQIYEVNKIRHYKFIFNKEEHPVTLVRVVEKKTKKYLKERSHLEELTFVEMGELRKVLQDYNLGYIIPIIENSKPYKT